MTGHTIVDGGLLSNFPLELFVSSDPQVIEVMGPKGSDRVLGMLIDESLPVSGAERVGKPEPEFGLGELHTVQRISNLLNTSLQAHDKMVIEAFENLVVHLPAKGYGTTEFDMTDERRALLVTAGRDAMQAYLDRQPAAPEAVSFGLMASEAADPARRAVDKLALKRLGKQRQAQ
jgi:predicted acylesterase/phospholipase RssA